MLLMQPHRIALLSRRYSLSLKAADAISTVAFYGWPFSADILTAGTSLSYCYWKALTTFTNGGYHTDILSERVSKLHHKKLVAGGFHFTLVYKNKTSMR